MPADRQDQARQPICLIRPPAGESVRFSTISIGLPLGLAYVAAALERSGRCVTVVDAVGEGFGIRSRYIRGFLVGLRLEDVVRRIPDDASMVGISVIFTHEWPAVARLIDLIKAARPDLPVLLGGEHATAMPEFCMRTSKADFLIRGEGEEPVIALADALESGQPLTEVDSLIFRDGESIVVNRRGQRQMAVDAIAWPAWHLFDVDGYNANGYIGCRSSDAISVPILATRGCPYQCTYCTSPNMWTPRWIPRDPLQVVDEIEHYQKTYGATHFPFEDLTAIVRKEWVATFCRELLRRGLQITWQMPTGTRAEAIDPEIADLMSRTGMIGMAYAPESGSETTRRLIKKKMDTEKLFASIEAAVQARLNVCIYIVIGFPHDTPEQLAENLPFLKRLTKYGVNHIAVHYYMALPGTELFHSLYDGGKIKLDSRYFQHILQSIGVFPLDSYCDNMGRVALTAWKFRLYGTFLLHARRQSKGRLAAGAPPREGSQLDGIFLDKIYRATSAAVGGIRDTVRSLRLPPWMPRDEEKRFFAPWDAAYREIRQGNLACGAAAVSPADTTELHRHNIVTKLRLDHESSRTLPPPAAGHLNGAPATN